MTTNFAPIGLLLGIGVIVAIWLALHWRYHIQSTPLDDVGRLQERLGGGRPVLIQFHAPL